MPPAPEADRSGGGAWIPYAVIAAAVLAAYANALGAAFQFDDWNVIVNEPRVGTLAAFRASMPGIRPLLKLTYLLNNLSGLGAAGFHAMNVAIHLAASWLVYTLFVRALPAVSGAGALSAAAPRVAHRHAALAGALLFALHPVQTEAVTYVSGRSCSLMALFALASVVTWLRAPGRFAFVWFAPALFAAALLVKETAVVLPLALLLVSGTVGPRRPLRAFLPFAAILAAATVAALASPVYRSLFAASLRVRGIGVNLLTQAHAVVYLIGQCVRLDRLNADPSLGVVEAWTPRTALDAAIVLGLVAFGLASIRKRPTLALGLLWFFVWLLPTNSILPRLDVVNDRQIYLALAGPAWVAACGIAALAGRRGEVLALCAALAVAAGLGVATHARNRVYAGEIVFWEDVTRKTPANGRAFNNLGYALALSSRTAEAEAAFRRALDLDPADVRAAVNLRLLREGALAERP